MKPAKALFDAAKRGDLETIRQLAEAGANLNETVTAGHNTPVTAAAAAGQLLAVQLLIELGARPEREAAYGQHALRQAIMKGRMAVVEYLLALPVFQTPLERRVALLDAICAKRRSIIMQLFQEGFPGDRPLFDGVRFLWAQDPVLRSYLAVSQRPDATWTALHYAAALGRDESTRVLLECRVSPDPRDTNQRTPLMLVDHHGGAVAASLLAAGADPSAVGVDGKGAAVLEKEIGARVEAELPAARRWWEKVQAAGGASAGSGKDQGAAAKQAVKGAASAGPKSEVGQLLEESARAGAIAGIRSAIESGAEIGWKLSQGKSALHLAAENGHLAAVEYLLQAGADTQPLDRSGKTAMHRAAAAGHADVVQALLVAGVSVDIPDRSGRTPLHEACGDSRLQVIKVLLEAGADPNARASKTGMTPFYDAFCKGMSAVRVRLQILQLLLDHGADPRIPPAGGSSSVYDIVWRNKDQKSYAGLWPMVEAAVQRLGEKER